MIKNKKILITGGGGFIGSALAEKLDENNKVTLLDKEFSDDNYSLPGLKASGNVSLVEADITDERSISGIVKDFQIILHTAAVVGVQEVIHDSLRTMEVNFGGTAAILKQIAGGSECERFVLFSTSEVFGANAPNVDENGDAVFSPISDPRWSYSISKLAAEQLSFGYHRQKDLPVVVIRPFNIFGPFRTGDYVIIRFILKALQNEDLEVYDDGSQVRAWCYIDDFCDAVLRAAEKKEAVGQAFNIGNPGNTLTIYELAAKIISLCNSSSKPVLKEMNFTDVKVRAPDISKARELLGFVPRIGIDEGLLRTIEWTEQNLGRLKEIDDIRNKKYML